MTHRALHLSLAIVLSFSITATADPGRQISADTAEAFLGAFLHGRVNGGRDVHLDVFGGAKLVDRGGLPARSRTSCSRRTKDHQPVAYRCPPIRAPRRTSRCRVSTTHPEP